MTQLVITDLTLQASVIDLIAADQLVYGGFLSFNKTTIKQNILNADVDVAGSVVEGSINVIMNVG